MAARIVPIGSGALCLLIALISASVLQPIDCAQSSTRLLQRIARSNILDVRRILESFESPHQVKLYDISVSELLRLTYSSALDCEPGELAKRNLMEAVKENPGLQKYCEFYFLKTFASCVYKFDSLLYPNLREHMNETDRAVLTEFYVHMSGWPLQPNQPGFLSFVQDELFLEKMTLFKAKMSNGGEEADQLETRLETSCLKAYGFLRVYDENPVKLAYFRENGQVHLWNHIRTLCDRYLEKYLLYTKKSAPDGKITWIAPRLGIPARLLRRMKYWGNRLLRRS